MIRNLLAGTLALGVLGFALQPAQAQAYEAPWCAVHSMGRNGAYWDCRYRTLEACVPSVIAGNRGFCNPNPAYAEALPAPHRIVRHRHRRHRHYYR